MANKSPSEIPGYINYPLPSYIKYLLLPSTPLDFHAIVGNPSTNSVERIGVMKWMLIARSNVFRVMLLESELRPEKEFTDSELEPATFRHFLVFLYGYDNTSALTFEDSVKLLSAADKYDVGDLMSKLGEVIKSQVTPQNVFIVLKNGPVCENEPILWERVTELLQDETEAVLSSPQFLNANPEVLLYILQQDALSVQEIDVWRAALKWAVHRVRSQKRPNSLEYLKVTMRPLLKHIRICTLSYEQLGKEVFPTQIFTEEEICNIFVSLNTKKKNDRLVNVCNEIVERDCNNRNIETFENKMAMGNNSANSYIFLEVKDRDIRLYLAVFMGSVQPYPYNGNNSGNQTYQCKGKIEISVTNQRESPLCITFDETVEYRREFSIPLKFNGRFVMLKANFEYLMNFTFDSIHPMFYNSKQFHDSEFYCISQGYGKATNQDVRRRGNQRYQTCQGNSGSNLKSLNYKVL